MTTGGFDRDYLLRLAQARRNKRLAEEAQNIASQQEREISPSKEVLIEEGRRATGNTPLGNPSLWSKIGSGFGKAVNT